MVITIVTENIEKTNTCCYRGSVIEVIDVMVSAVESDGSGSDAYITSHFSTDFTSNIQEKKKVSGREVYRTH